MTKVCMTINELSPDVYLFHDKDEFYAKYTELTGEPCDFDLSMVSGYHATGNCGSDMSALIYVESGVNSVLDEFATLIHEATHVKQTIFAIIGEKNPGREEEAYFMQHLCKILIEEHTKWVFEHKDLYSDPEEKESSDEQA